MYFGELPVKGVIRMTAAQRTELDKAIDRACKAGLEVVAKGYRKADGAKIYAVPSQSEANRWHIVTLLGNRLLCDCQSRVVCAHRGAVHMELVVEADRRQQLAEDVEAALRDEREATSRRLLDDAARRLETVERSLDAWEQEREQAREKRETAPLYRDNRPISIFK